MSNWLPIESAPKDGTTVDLFGYIRYDFIEMRLTDCEYMLDKWHYFCAGEMLPCDGPIAFTPTHWMPLPVDPA